MKKLRVLRMNKINFVKGGQGGVSPKINLPVAFLKDMGIDETKRDVIISYDNIKKEIKITKRLEVMDENVEYEFVKIINDCFTKILTIELENNNYDAFWLKFCIQSGNMIYKDNNQVCGAYHSLIYKEEIIATICLYKDRISFKENSKFLIQTQIGRQIKDNIEKLEKDLKHLTSMYNIKMTKTIL